MRNAHTECKCRTHTPVGADADMHYACAAFTLQCKSSSCARLIVKTHIYSGVQSITNNGILAFVVDEIWMSFLHKFFSLGPTERQENAQPICYYRK